MDRRCGSDICLGRLRHQWRSGVHTSGDRADTILVSTTTYNDDGEVFSTFDPQSTETRLTYDDAGHQVIQIENYVSRGTAADPNRTTWTNYTADGQVFTLTASISTRSGGRFVRKYC